MNIVRYINGKRVEERELKNYALESPAAQRAIKAANKRQLTVDS